MLIIQFLCFAVALIAMPQKALSQVFGAEHSIEQTSNFHYLDYEIGIILPSSDIDNFFRGQMTIKFRPSHDLDSILLNGINLVMSNILVKSGDGSTIFSDIQHINNSSTIVRSSYDVDEEYKLTLEYYGELASPNDYAGIYRMREDSCQRATFFTVDLFKFSTCIFPQIDDSTTLASYRLRLQISSANNYSFVSNMPTTIRTNGWIEFKKTPQMQPHALAFALLPNCYELYIDGTTNVWAQRNQMKMVSKTLTLASIRSREFDETFQIESDHENESLFTILIIPSFPLDYLANYKIAFFRESTIYRSSGWYINRLIGTSIVENWLPYVASMRSDSSYILIGGLADYFALKNVGNLNEDFLNEVSYTLTYEDEKENIVLVDYGKTLENIGNILYLIKANMMFSMLNTIMGADNLAAGIKEIYTTYEDSYFSYNQFFTVLQKYLIQSHHTMQLNELMMPWIQEGAYPIIKVSCANGEMFIEQEYETLWYIPLTYTSSGNPNFQDTMAKIWLTQKNMRILLAACPKWIIFNIQQTTYMRVYYSPEIYEGLAEALAENIDMIPLGHRIILIDTALHQYKNGELTFSAFETLLEAFILNETEFTPLFKVIEIIWHFMRVMQFSDNNILFEHYLKSVVNRRVETLNEGTPMDVYNLIQSLGSYLGIQQSLDIAKQYFSAWKATNDMSFMPKIGGEEYICSVLKYSLEEVQFVFSIYRTITDHHLKNYLVGILQCSQDESLITRFLEDTNMMTDNADIKERYEELTASKQWANLTWQFIINQYEAGNDRPISTLPTIMSSVDLAWIIKLMIIRPDLFFLNSLIEQIKNETDIAEDLNEILTSSMKNILYNSELLNKFSETSIVQFDIENHLIAHYE